jgi:cytochrome c oxidase assembly protein subunit 15
MNHRGFHRWVLILLGVMLIQLAFGALMAGHKAATAASTWPTINGEWFPFSLQNLQLKDFVENFWPKCNDIEFPSKMFFYRAFIRCKSK